MTDQEMTPVEAAAYIGVTKGTLWRYRKLGISPPYSTLRLPSGRLKIIYTKTKLDAWLNERRAEINGDSDSAGVV